MCFAVHTEHNLRDLICRDIVKLLTNLDRKCIGTYTQTFEMPFLAIGFYFYVLFKNNWCHKNCCSPLMLTYFDKLLRQSASSHNFHYIFFLCIRQIVNTDNLACNFSVCLESYTGTLLGTLWKHSLHCGGTVHPCSIHAI